MRRISDFTVNTKWFKVILGYGNAINYEQQLLL